MKKYWQHVDWCRHVIKHRFNQWGAWRTVPLPLSSPLPQHVVDQHLIEHMVIRKLLAVEQKRWITKSSIKWPRDRVYSRVLGLALPPLHLLAWCFLLYRHCRCYGKDGLGNWPSLSLLQYALVPRRWTATKLAICWRKSTLEYPRNIHRKYGRYKNSKSCHMALPCATLQSETTNQNLFKAKKFQCSNKFSEKGFINQ